MFAALKGMFFRLQVLPRARSLAVLVRQGILLVILGWSIMARLLQFVFRKKLVLREQNVGDDLSRKSNRCNFDLESQSSKECHLHENWSSQQYYFEDAGGTPRTEI